MLIKIVVLLLLFIFIVFLSKKKEGLMNQYTPVSIRKTDPDYIYRKMVTSGDPLYDTKFTLMKEAEVISDMSYFNNATSILYMLGR
jgi:hypothetical protein